MQNAKDIILASAENLFAKYGYEKTTVEDIAKAAGKAKTAIYYYFDGKATIMRTVMDKEIHHMISRLDALNEEWQEDCPDKLIAFLKAHMEILSELKVYVANVAVPPAGISGELGAIMHEARAELDRYETEWFFHICTVAKEEGTFTEDVSPRELANMLIMLLKSIEYYLFTSDNKTEVLGTYNALIDKIVYGCSNQIAK